MPSGSARLHISGKLVRFPGDDYPPWTWRVGDLKTETIVGVCAIAFTVSIQVRYVVEAVLNLRLPFGIRGR